MKIKKAVSELRPGMYVYELDRPWLDTPYPLQGFLIASDEDIGTLKQYCEHVFIDPLKEQVNVSTTRLKAGPLARIGESSRGSAPVGAVVYTDQHVVEREIPRAQRALQEAQEAVAHIRDLVSTSKTVDLRSATVLVDSLIDSIVANPDAVMLLVRLRHESESAYDHAITVAVNMLAFGRQIGLPRSELGLVGLAGLLLDVGMLQLPPELLNKAGPLTPAEHALIKRHVQYSEDILRKTTGIPPRVIEIVGEHHERENGSGYPRGLPGSALSVYGKMAAIVDCYRDLTAGRAGRAAVSTYEALEIMHGWTGQFFQPTLLEQFIQCIGIYPVGSLIELNTGEVAIVVAHSRVRRLRPRVMIILDPRKKPYATPIPVDLINEPLSAAGVPFEIKRGLEHGMYGVNPEDYYL
jgi:HD-GYP domain-containing protein (c-di-GMP phosphodiesterase class II)